MILDNIEEIKKLDKKQVALSIERLPDQLEQAWLEALSVSFPDSYKQVKNILVDGMGGSGLGPEIVNTVFKDKINVPMTLIHDYHLPAFVDGDTLVLISSYSGNTEEPLNAGEEALAKNYKVAGITEGGKLAEFLKVNKLPGFVFNAPYNPSHQPRLGLGYQVGGILGMFRSLGFINISDEEMDRVLFCSRELNQKLSPGSPTSENFAKELATKIQGNIVVVIAAEPLSANAHVFANHLNETSKTFSTYFIIPELNHHLLEGLNKPAGLGERLKVIVLESDLYSDKIKKRVQITKDIIEKQKIETISVKIEGDTALIQAFEALLVSSWTTFYLAILNGFDPSEIPWVDYFKEQLAK
ncbi:MAG: bifunctional phosphoglucose/phosphomannose isomerase [Candidatus Woykebacteria bacterium]